MMIQLLTLGLLALFALGNAEDKRPSPQAQQQATAKQLQDQEGEDTDDDADEDAVIMDDEDTSDQD